MKSPKDIPIGGYTVPVVQCQLQLNTGLCGESAYSPVHMIRIDQGLGSDKKDCVFWHEVIHQINYVYCNGALCEDEVDHIASGLHQVMNSLGVRFDWK